MDAFVSDEDRWIWKCRQHSFHQIHGVCPYCLRHRLLLLCPDCASLRPCRCLPSSSSSSSSSFSSFSLPDPSRSSVGYTVGSTIGSMGRVGALIHGEPAFRRSRSAAYQFLRPKSSPSGETERHAATGRRRWITFWSFSKASDRREKEAAPAAKLWRSRSVAGTTFAASDGGVGVDGRTKGWKWSYLSPMKAFQHRKKAAKISQRTPFVRV